MPRRRRLALAVGLAAGVGLIGGIGFAVWNNRSGAAPTAADAAGAPAAAEAAPAPAASIAKETKLTATSPDATVGRDVPVPMPPPPPTPTAEAPAGPRASRPTGGAAKAIFKKAPADGDSNAKAVLPAPDGASPTPPKAAPPADCAHPFFVDSDGIKRFRPECM
jgi:hypothetical protein